MGPDEYHDPVDDNAYTNLMARWNLRRGAEAAALLAEQWPSAWTALKQRLAVTQSEVAGWEITANGLVDGLDTLTGLIEQFAGYHALDDLDLETFEPRAVPMDVLLGIGAYPEDDGGQTGRHVDGALPPLGGLFTRGARDELPVLRAADRAWELTRAGYPCRFRRAIG